MKDVSLARLFAAISYSDVFNFPLTIDEVFSWYIGPVGTSKREIRLLIEKGVKMGYFEIAVVHQQSYIVLSGRKKIIRQRHLRFLASRTKWLRAIKTANWLRFIPTIVMLGVTGGLAMDNADEDDDIDFFIVCRNDTLWITRLMVTLLVEFTGRRRHPAEKELQNSICLNMFLTEKSLGVSRAQRDLYTAHEVLQLRPLWAKGQVYKRYLEKNSWAKNFLARAFIQRIRESSRITSENESKWNIFFPVWQILNLPARYLQLWYMAKRRTNEYISDTLLRFHPIDAREWIKAALGKRLAPYDIPLDNIFYSS